MQPIVTIVPLEDESWIPIGFSPNSSFIEIPGTQPCDKKIAEMYARQIAHQNGFAYVHPDGRFMSVKKEGDRYFPVCITLSFEKGLLEKKCISAYQSIHCAADCAKQIAFKGRMPFSPNFYLDDKIDRLNWFLDGWRCQKEKIFLSRRK
ncbi:MAG: hypothetical protein JSS09_00660 [Verrucomicrobia bacterium]|nr:hypothetical protein [Verrucomicrobiota bacterium]